MAMRRMTETRSKRYGITSDDDGKDDASLKTCSVMSYRRLRSGVRKGRNSARTVMTI